MLSRIKKTNKKEFSSSNSNILQKLLGEARNSLAPDNSQKRSFRNTVANIYNAFNRLPLSMRAELIALAANVLAPMQMVAADNADSKWFSFSDKQSNVNYVLHTLILDNLEVLLNQAVAACNSSIPMPIDSLPSNYSLVEQTCHYNVSGNNVFEFFRFNLSNPINKFEKCMDQVLSDECPYDQTNNPSVNIIGIICLILPWILICGPILLAFCCRKKRTEENNNEVNDNIADGQVRAIDFNYSQTLLPLASSSINNRP